MKRDTLTEGGKQRLSFIPEGDVYRLVATSQLPSAQKFETWVFDDVLPTLRKTGRYVMPKKAGEESKRLDQADKRLAIMERNCNHRQAKLLLAGVKAFADVMSPESKKVFMVKYGEIVAQINLSFDLPKITEKSYTAGEIGAEIGLSGNKVGRIAKANGIKGKEGERNEYSFWVRDKIPLFIS